MKVLVINGPNINMLGIREPETYGNITYAQLCGLIGTWCGELGLEHEHFQSNHEGAIVDAIQDAFGRFDGIVINPAAYTHTSIAILDALKAVSIPTVEVHISDIAAREEFRRFSYISGYAIATVKGEGPDGYRRALSILKRHLEHCAD